MKQRCAICLSEYDNCLDWNFCPFCGSSLKDLTQKTNNEIIEHPKKIVKFRAIDKDLFYFLLSGYRLRNINKRPKVFKCLTEKCIESLLKYRNTIINKNQLLNVPYWNAFIVDNIGDEIMNLITKLRYN